MSTLYNFAITPAGNRGELAQQYALSALQQHEGVYFDADGCAPIDTISLLFCKYDVIITAFNPDKDVCFSSFVAGTVISEK